MKMLRLRKDTLKILKKAGYNTTRLRKENILAQSTMTRLRRGDDICLSTLSRICDLTGMSYDYFIEEVEGGEEV